MENQATDQKSPLEKKPKLIKPITYLLIFSFVFFFVFFGRTPNSNQSGDSWVYKIPIIGQIKHLAESSDKKLKGEDRGRINILLLGMGGKRHEGGYLTDTIMLVSLEPESQKISLLSIPRDLSIPMENEGWRKINNINAYAEVNSPGTGGLAVSQALSDILEMPIDYYVRLDFEGFVNIIDELGGLKVYVENTLSDKKYPIAGMEDAENYSSRFEHLYLEKGWHKMDGELALKYARSRHGVHGEGSDFARAKRQQIIMEAAKEKLISKYNIFKPLMVSNIINELQEHVSTNLKIWEIVKLWGMGKNIEKKDIINKVLDNGPNGLLTDMITEEGAYVLIPRSGDFSEIEYLVKNIFSDAPPEYKARVKVEKASVEIRNGTWINGLAARSSMDLEKYGFDIIRIGNSSQRNFQKSVIYDLSYGEKLKSLAVLKEKTNANVSFNLPRWLIDDISKDIANEKNPLQPDFILLLGQDADKTKSGAENIIQ